MKELTNKYILKTDITLTSDKIIKIKKANRLINVILTIEEQLVTSEFYDDILLKLKTIQTLIKDLPELEQELYGGNNNKYKNKYIKYKQKYLKLKNIF
jgi:hypothetical protein